MFKIHVFVKKLYTNSLCIEIKGLTHKHSYDHHEQLLTIQTDE